MPRWARVVVTFEPIGEDPLIGRPVTGPIAARLIRVATQNIRHAKAALRVPRGHSRMPICDLRSPATSLGRVEFGTATLRPGDEYRSCESENLMRKSRKARPILRPDQRVGHDDP
jgi:hypothetical protein